VKSLNKSKLAFFLIIGLVNLQCRTDKKAKEESLTEATPITITKNAFGTTPEGKAVEQYVLANSQGMEVSVITYGGIITSWKVPGKDGALQDVVLGYDSLGQYLESNPYFGALIGRYGNRIAGAAFTIDGQEYSLAKNDGPNHLHGGLKGFDKVVWTARAEQSDKEARLILSYTSPDGEEGYPGTLQTTVTYTLKDDNSLEVRYEAETDQPTVVNLTQHTYFNLSGDYAKPILDHVVNLNADGYLPVDNTLIPTGEIATVKNTPFDFTDPKLIGQDIDKEHPQLEKGKGYDHCWVLNGQGTGVRLAATAYHAESGRFLEVFTDEPGIQFYTGNFLDGSLPAKGGGSYGHRSGFCLETQHYPDSPNQEAFPSVRLDPGQKYTTTTRFKFSTK
jgi:aldose 1-epimerase